MTEFLKKQAGALTVALVVMLVGWLIVDQVKEAKALAAQNSVDLNAAIQAAAKDRQEIMQQQFRNCVHTIRVEMALHQSLGGNWPVPDPDKICGGE